MYVPVCAYVCVRVCISLLVHVCLCLHEHKHVSNGRIPVLSKDESYSTLQLPHIFSTLPPSNGHLGCFHILSIVNSAAGDMREKVTLEILISAVSDRCLEVGLVDRTVVTLLVS